MVKIQPCKVVPKRLAFVFSGPPEMNAQIVRLTVLYEDLKIEVRGSENTLIDELMDETSKQYRELYFLRRAFATIIEISGAVHQLDCSKDFAREIAKFFSDEDANSWKGAVKFFAANKKFLKTQRNLYGGHFHDDAARYALLHLSADHVDLLEVKIFDRHQVRVILRFVLEFVGLALTAARGDQDYRSFIPESFATILDAQKHATRAVQLIAKYYLLPRFGMTGYPQPRA